MTSSIIPLEIPIRNDRYQINLIEPGNYYNGDTLVLLYKPQTKEFIKAAGDTSISYTVYAFC